MARARAHCLWLLLLLAGCPPDTSTSEANGCGGGACGKTSTRAGGKGTSSSTGSKSGASGGSSGVGLSTMGSTSAAATGGSSSGSVPTSSSTAGGSSSSGGSTSANPFITNETVCPAVAIGATASTCPSGSPFSSQLVDLIDCSTIGGATITALDANGIPVSGASATTAPNGGFAMCLPQDSPFSIQIVAANYPTSYYAELDNGGLGSLSQIGAISNSIVGAFTVFAPGGFQPDKAVIVVKITGSTCSGQYAGWSFGITLPDGGAVPAGDYQRLYIGATDAPDLSATATTSAGAELLYNVDPTLSNFLDVTASNPDAGACGGINQVAGFTGRVYVAQGAFTLYPFLLP